MRHLGRSLCVASLLAMLPATAMAATKSFYIDRSDLLNGAGNASGNLEGMPLQDGVTNYAIFSFVVPADYKKNSPILIKYLMLSGDSGCNFEFEVDAVERTRVGQPQDSQSGAASGLSQATPGPVPAPGTVGFITGFKLRPATVGSLAHSQKAGDSILVSIQRNGANDTCSSTLMVQGVKITYTTR